MQWKWLKAVVWGAFKNLKPDRDSIVGYIFSAVVGALSLIHQGREQAMNQLRPYLTPAIVFVAALWLWAMAKAAFDLYTNAEERAIKAEAECAKAFAKPIITFVVKDAFVLPFDSEARCFLRLSLHNETEIPCSNPTEYRFSLKIAGNDYQEGAFINLAAYQLEHYKLIETYENDERKEEEESLTKERLTDIRSQSTNLTKGAPVEGWLGFAVHYVPKWQSDKEYTGQYYEEVYEENIGGMIKILVDNFHLVHNTNAIEELKITVIDAYGQAWPAVLTGSFTKRGKRIIPPLPRQDWDD